ncbi:MAG: tRNA pseudouridine(55) synthase TruB [Ruminococcus sp.]|nr:tRNA pseudouridine(55) synthase TruB [Ruminococcus sp.]MDE6784431.1 tRNA pseudouridine(55) synthase TruB [Ruminococcus sp.]
MNGIIGVNKPSGFTSFDVIAKLRGILKKKRIGHSGTLDPMATGVLPVFIGNATKACDIIPDTSKAYRAGFRLGISTDTLDITGKITAEYSLKVTEKDTLDVIPKFTGNIKQIPPMYSAVKIGGQKLCNLARKGIEIERPEREITVDSIKLESFDEASQSGVISVICSKGTYIRSLIDDIGNSLGCGGVMTSLVRTRSGGFSLDDCFTLEEIQNLADSGNVENVIISVERIFSGLPKIRLNEVQTRMYKNGVRLDLNRINHIKPEFSEYSVYGFDHEFIGVARADFEKCELRVVKNFI